MKNIVSKIIFSVFVLLTFLLSANNVLAAANSSCYGSTAICASKKVINLTSGNLNWQTTVNANPYDIISFAITLQTGDRAIHNVTIKEYLPSNLVYAGNLLVNSSLNYAGNPVNGINIGTIPANGVAVISYQAKVYPNNNLPYGVSSLNIPSVITGSEGPVQNLSAQVFVNNQQIFNNQQIYYGATYLPTGITNNPIKDSFFIPLFLIIIGSWLYFTGRVYKFADWIKTKIQ